MNDIITFIPILLLILFLFLLSTREIKKSLEQSKISTKLLAQDRNILRLRLSESTRALRESELARINELTRAAEFGRLAQGLFHDLMTPMTSMILHTERLTDPHAANLAKIKEAGNRITSYVHDIRATLSHEESEHLCSLKDELESVLHLLAYRARENKVEIRVSCQSEPTWYGNALKIRQIFSNLITNSLDACARDINIILTENYAQTTIKVCDTGSGISAQNMKKVFEPFFTTKAVDKGTGIGLTTVKSLVEKDLKGTISIESTENQGTQVTIVFPRRYTDPASSPQLRHTPPLHE